MTSPAPERLRAAYIRRPHGVRGEVRVEPVGGDAARFHRGLRLRTDPGDRELSVLASRSGAGGTVLLAFAGVDTPEAARELCNRYLTVAAADARDLGHDEWFVWQLCGLRAVTADGRDLGVVEDVESGIANDVVVVRGAGVVRRFPMVRSCVQAVDLAGGSVTIDALEELEV